MACGILVPWAGIKPSPLALGAWNLKHGTASENPAIFLIVSWLVCSFFVPLFLLCWFPSWFDTFLCMHAKLLPLCPTLCHPMDCSSPGSSVHGILQVRITGVGCRFLLQGISRTSGWNSGPDTAGYAVIGSWSQTQSAMQYCDRVTDTAGYAVTGSQTVGYAVLW